MWKKNEENLGNNSMRIGFHLLHDFHHAMLNPIYSLLKDEFPCLITKDVDSIIAFKPKILILADAHYYRFRGRLPVTIIVWIRHGFSSKNFLRRSITGCDFACVSSKWVRNEYIRRGWNPRLGFWVTGFPPMDRVLSQHSTQIRAVLPEDFEKGKATLLYAPTWNRFLNSVEPLGDKWIDRLRKTLPDINVIIKPHPHIPKLFPLWMAMWQKSVRRNERTLLIEDCNSDIYEYLTLADILLSDASSTIFYFLALDRPIILVNNPLRFKDWEYFDPEGPEWKWRDIGIEISSAEELPHAVQRCLEKPAEKAELRAFYRERIFGNFLDGYASDRIAGQVRSLLNPEIEDKERVSISWKTISSLGPLDKKRSIFYRIRSLLVPLADSLNRYPRLKFILKTILFWPVR